MVLSSKINEKCGATEQTKPLGCTLNVDETVQSEP